MNCARNWAQLWVVLSFGLADNPIGRLKTRVSWACPLTAPLIGQRLKVTTRRRGPLVVGGDGVVDSYRFRIDKNDSLYVEGQGGPYREPQDMAEEVLERAFVADLVRSSR